MHQQQSGWWIAFRFSVDERDFSLHVGLQTESGNFFSGVNDRSLELTTDLHAVTTWRINSSLPTLVFMVCVQATLFLIYVIYSLFIYFLLQKLANTPERFILFYTLYRLHMQLSRSCSAINLLKTKRNLLYIRNQSVPHCKHFPPRL